LKPAEIEENSVKNKAAVAYLRTSSATNLGSDKDSERRQREAVQAFTKKARLKEGSTDDRA
jgi:hypothetical protein